MKHLSFDSGKTLDLLDSLPERLQSIHWAYKATFGSPGTEMRYLKWDRHDMSGIELLGLTELLTEVDPSGRVTREIGLDSQGRVVHRFPGAADRYGLFDGQVIEAGPGEIDGERFEALWTSE